jgi:hypothetical protein
MKIAFATLITTLGVLSGCATSLDKYSGTGGTLHSHFISGNYDSVVSRAYQYCKDRRLEIDSINQISSGCIVGCDTEFHKYQFSCAVQQAKLNKNAVSLLPPCPEPDYSKKTDAMRHAKWHNCWGRYKVEFKDNWKGTFFEGEWHNGRLDGYGTMLHPKGDQYAGQYKSGEFNGQGTYTFANGDKYVGEYKDGNKHGQGTFFTASGNKYVGEYKDGKMHGQGTYTFAQGHGYTGEWLDAQPHGKGRETYADGRQPNEGVFEKGKFIREAKLNQTALSNNVTTNSDRTEIDRERQQLAEERRRLEDQKKQRDQAVASQRINLQVSNTSPSSDGAYTISIQTNTDTASLKINGEELGGKADGRYSINRVARAGLETKIDIVAKDVYGNTDSKTIVVSRPVVESKVIYAALNPAQVKRQTERDAIAIIIGVSNYKTLPKAEFANDDARVFYDYAIRALGVKAENIKLLVDADADEVEIIKAFKTWLPSRTKSTTDVYVYYSGHGLPTPDGQGLYILPPRADRDFISRTSIQFQEINADIQAVKPKSVTIFMDACYSGQARNGETLVASARPIALKAEKKLFPDNFTVITASQADQISLSSPDLKHGIFSYYLMKGMEGDADANKDGKITLNEMQAYLVDNVSRHAGTVGQKQVPQVSGEVNQVLVGR